MRVDLNGSDFAAVLELANVGISNGCLHRRAAVLGFLDQALVDLAGEVAGVELGDRTHDAVKKHSTGRLVDVLATRDERYVGCGQGDVDFDVVNPVSGKPVHLVDNAEVDVIFGNEGEHPLQFRTARAAGAFATIDELFNYHSAQRCCFAAAGVPLRGDREAFRFTATRRLLFR